MHVHSIEEFRRFGGCNAITATGCTHKTAGKLPCAYVFSVLSFFRNPSVTCIAVDRRRRRTYKQFQESHTRMESVVFNYGRREQTQTQVTDTFFNYWNLQHSVYVSVNFGSRSRFSSWCRISCDTGRFRQRRAWQTSLYLSVASRTACS